MYKLRERNLQKEIEIKDEIRELEKKALQSQMNPHFIFNCLNSIQNFVMENEKILAMDYLSKFAKLIRYNLNASLTSKTLISDEISHLTNYLSLEKLRFKDKFNFEITLDHNLENSETFIPPLLIQPIVENAIIHGMRNIQRGGNISINITKAMGTVQVTVKDNGTGIEKLNEKNSIKSYGMSITAKRLAFINNAQDQSY